MPSFPPRSSPPELVVVVIPISKVNKPSEISLFTFGSSSLVPSLPLCSAAGLTQGMQPRHRSKSSSALQFPLAKEAAGSFRLRDSSPNLQGHRERRGRRVVQECDCRFVSDL